MLMRKNILNTTACGLAALTLVAFTAPGFAQGHAGGAAGTHMSTQGSVNTNGPNATDRDKGKARAQDRKSTNGDTHAKAKAKGHSNTDTK